MTLREQIARAIARDEHERLSLAMPAGRGEYIARMVEKHWPDKLKAAEEVIQLTRAHDSGSPVPDLLMQATIQHHPLSGRGH